MANALPAERPGRDEFLSLAKRVDEYADRLLMPCLEGQFALQMAEQLRAGAVSIDLTYSPVSGLETPSLQRYNQALTHLQLFLDDATALGCSILRSDSIEG